MKAEKQHMWESLQFSGRNRNQAIKLEWKSRRYGRELTRKTGSEKGAHVSKLLSLELTSEVPLRARSTTLSCLIPGSL